MSIKTSSSPRWGRRAALAALTALVALFCAGTAQAAGEITRVEEDWRVEIGVPDADTNAPQIITVVSPNGSLNGAHAVFELNHSTLSSYTPGGMQLQRWNGETPVVWNNFPNNSVQSTPDEVITYTISTYLSGGNLFFEVSQGNSSTWGSFGGQGYLKNVAAYSALDLGVYDPEFSVTHSKVGFASFRVKRFVRTAVRYYSNSGLVSTDTTPRVVHEYNGGT